MRNLADIYRQYFKQKIAKKLEISDSMVASGYVDEESVCGVLVQKVHNHENLNFVSAEVIVSYMNTEGAKILEFYDAIFDNKTNRAEAVTKKQTKKIESRSSKQVQANNRFKKLLSEAIENQDLVKEDNRFASKNDKINYLRNLLYTKANQKIKKNVKNGVVDIYKKRQASLFKDDDENIKPVIEVTPEMLFKD